MDQHLPDNGRATANRRRRRNVVALVAGLAAILTAGSAAFSLARFTSSVDATGDFTTGTIVLTTNPTPTLFNLSNIMPGDSGSATLTITNGGTGALRYAMTSSSTNTDTKGLRDAVALTIKAGSCPGGGANLSAVAVLNGAAIGDPTQGAQTGDRTLAGGASENLCFAWSLPLATGNAYQNASTTTTFTFAAEQTANNP